MIIELLAYRSVSIKESAQAGKGMCRAGGLLPRRHLYERLAFSIEQILLEEICMASEFKG